MTRPMQPRTHDRRERNRYVTALAKIHRCRSRHRYTGVVAQVAARDTIRARIISSWVRARRGAACAHVSVSALCFLRRGGRGSDTDGREADAPCIRNAWSTVGSRQHTQVSSCTDLSCTSPVEGGHNCWAWGDAKRGQEIAAGAQLLYSAWALRCPPTTNRGTAPAIHACCPGKWEGRKAEKCVERIWICVARHLGLSILEAYTVDRMHMRDTCGMARCARQGIRRACVWL